MICINPALDPLNRDQKELPYAIDIGWFNKIHCRHPQYGCIGFIEYFILDDNDQIIDSIKLYPEETTNNIIYKIDKERYDKIKKYMED